MGLELDKYHVFEQWFSKVQTQCISVIKMTWERRSRGDNRSWGKNKGRALSGKGWAAVSQCLESSRAVSGVITGNTDWREGCMAGSHLTSEWPSLQGCPRVAFL